MCATRLPQVPGRRHDLPEHLKEAIVGRRKAVGAMAPGENEQGLGSGHSGIGLELHPDCGGQPLGN